MHGNSKLYNLLLHPYRIHDNPDCRCLRCMGLQVHTRSTRTPQAAPASLCHHSRCWLHPPDFSENSYVQLTVWKKTKAKTTYTDTKTMAKMKRMMTMRRNKKMKKPLFSSYLLRVARAPHSVVQQPHFHAHADRPVQKEHNEINTEARTSAQCLEVERHSRVSV